MCFAQICLHLNWEKMRFDCNFWLGGPIDTRSMCLNCILQDLFRDTPLDHIWRAQIRPKIQSNTSKGRRYIYLGKIHFLTSVSICSRTKNVNFQKKVFLWNTLLYILTQQCNDVVLFKQWRVCQCAIVQFYNAHTTSNTALTSPWRHLSNFSVTHLPNSELMTDGLKYLTSKISAEP